MDKKYRIYSIQPGRYKPEESATRQAENDLVSPASDIQVPIRTFLGSIDYLENEGR